MSTKLSVKVIIGLVVIGLVGIPTYAEKKSSTLNWDAIDKYLRSREYEKAIQELENELKKEKPEEICGPDGLCRLKWSPRALEIKKLLVRAHYLSGALGSKSYKEQVKIARKYALEIAHEDEEFARKDNFVYALSQLKQSDRQAYIDKYLNKPAPELSVKEWINSGPLTLSGLKGKVILLEFWSMTCGPCVGEMPRLEKKYQEYKDKGLIVIGVHYGISDIEGLKKFVKENKITFPVAIDRGKRWGSDTFKAYGIKGIPSPWLIDKEGKVREGGWKSSLQISVETLLKE